jgi:hypothetical protein
MVGPSHGERGGELDSIVCALACVTSRVTEAFTARAAACTSFVGARPSVSSGLLVADAVFAVDASDAPPSEPTSAPTSESDETANLSTCRQFF